MLLLAIFTSPVMVDIAASGQKRARPPALRNRTSHARLPHPSRAFCGRVGGYAILTFFATVRMTGQGESPLFRLSRAAALLLRMPVAKLIYFGNACSAF